MDRSCPKTEEEWLQLTEDLKSQRDRLNSYVEALHEKGKQGFSVFEAVSAASLDAQIFRVSFDSKDAHDEQSYEHLAELAGRLGLTHGAVATCRSLSIIRCQDWSFKWEGELLAAIDGLRAALGGVRSAGQALSDELGLRADPELQASRRTHLKALVTRLSPAALDLTQVPDDSADKLSRLVESLAADLEKRASATTELSASYPLESISDIPLERLDADWREAQSKFWPASSLAKRKTQKFLQTYASGGVADPETDLKALLDIRKHHSSINGNPLAAVAETSTGPNSDKAAEAVRQASEFRSTSAGLSADAEDAGRHAAAMNRLCSAAGSNVPDALRNYIEAEALLETKLAAFMRCGGIWPEGLSAGGFDAGLAAAIRDKAQFSDWAKWVKLSEEAKAKGLGGLVEALERGEFGGENAREAFVRSYANWWVPLAIDASSMLREFAHWEHQNAIDSFNRLDDEIAALAPAEVLRRIAHGLPQRDSVPKKSELGILRHQLSLTRPSMPIRQLLSKIPESFGKLAPCVLMSPLSVAQYLPSDRATFDVVIFDEASQIFTWDAISSIARGRQTIIVGDPKQLPPTNFFGRTDDDDEEMPELERDMPSILDEVSASGVPHRILNWHYRSRDESLIAFSNHNYYDDRLVTFPAPSTESHAVRFHHVDGVYARGGGRFNQAEAQAVADLIRERLLSYLDLPAESRPTIGVITLNAQQQSLILDLLDKLRSRNSDFEWFFSDDREEPLIVKNLENIQGDERDVMILSVTFGKDLAGKLTMNFGALNGVGGEKRLNVAVTRARREFHVFASIKAEQIDLNRSNAVGVKDLKAFLDYAERGPIALPAQEHGSLGFADSPFEESVARALSAKGWEVRNQIGVSGFRIDLGVVHPDFAGRYIAGIECDGATYHSSATARDRDKVRQSVLEGLGWTILRIWSTDWFRNPTAVADRIHGKLGELLESDRAERRAAREPAAESAEEIDSRQDSESAPRQANSEFFRPGPIEIANDPSGNSLDLKATDAPAGVKGLGPAEAVSRRWRRPSRKIESHGNGVDRSSQRPVPLENTASWPEESSDSLEDLPALDPDRFLDDDYGTTLRQLIRSIVEREGRPMPLNELVRRVAQEHGWQRAGRRIRDRVTRNLQLVDTHSEADADFVWKSGSHADRVPFRGLDGRPIRDVSRAEVCSAADANIETIADAEDPVLALARCLGISRLSGDARAYLRDCLQYRNSTDLLRQPDPD